MPTQGGASEASSLITRLQSGYVCMVCMVLASSHYDENDYFRDYGEYLQARGLATLLPPNSGSPVIAMGGLT